MSESGKTINKAPIFSTRLSELVSYEKKSHMGFDVLNLMLSSTLISCYGDCSRILPLFYREIEEWPSVSSCQQSEAELEFFVCRLVELTCQRTLKSRVWKEVV